MDSTLFPVNFFKELLPYYVTNSLPPDHKHKVLDPKIEWNAK